MSAGSGGWYEGLRQATRDAEDQANAETPLSDTPTSTRRDLTGNIGAALPNPEGDRQGDRLQPIASVADPLLT